MIQLDIDSSFVGEGVSWIDDTIKYIGERNKLALKKIANIIQSDITENVLQSRSINGGKVERNALSTAKQKGFNRPLFRTGLLAGSIAQRSIAGGYEVFVRGKANDYAGFNQFGTRNIPARPFFGISQETDNDIDTELENIL